MSNCLTVILLSAGYGSRLRPFTESLPKCLMPVNGRPLLEYWLEMVRKIGPAKVIVNSHYLSETVQRFVERPIFSGWVQCVHELVLLGTAGTLRANESALRGSTVLLVHADNYSQCDLNEFLNFHQTLRPKYCPLTMMTFVSRDPGSCGIVQLDANGVVLEFHEKISNPPGNLANGAVYLLEEEVIDWICNNGAVSDFSTQVLPHFLGRIATWHNHKTHIDIGTIGALVEAQRVLLPNGESSVNGPGDPWTIEYQLLPIHRLIKSELLT